MKNYRKIITILIIILLLFVISSLGFYREIKVTYYTFKSSKLPSSFNDFKIVQISDLHCSVFGHNQEELISQIANLDPDIIILTGDMIDKNSIDISSIDYLIREISSLAPIYSVDGNHDISNKRMYDRLELLYNKYGVIDLNRNTTNITIGDETIYLHGENESFQYNEPTFRYPDPSNFNILLYHYGNYFDKIQKYKYDLAFTGLTHGGVICLPLIGGIISNDGSLFPKYDYGLYTKGSTTMILSRGLGETDFPRFFNRPEIVCTILKHID